MPPRNGIRIAAGWIFWPAIILIALNVERLAEHLGWDLLLVNYGDSAMDNILSALQSAWVQYPAMFFIGVAAAFWLDEKLKRKEINDLALNSQSSIPPWLKKTIEDDDINIHSLIWLNPTNKQGTLDTFRVNPCILLSVTITNASIFDIIITEVDGYTEIGAKFTRERMSQNARLTEDNLVIKHGSAKSVIIEQLCSDNEIENIKDKIPAFLKTGNFAILYKYTNQNGEEKMKRLAFPDEFFEISQVI